MACAGTCRKKGLQYLQHPVSCRHVKFRTAALSGYLDRIMEGQYDTLMQDDTGSVLEDSIYKAVVLLREGHG